LRTVPVLVDKDAPASGAMVLDRKSSGYGNVLVATSDDYYFNRDTKALRATFRFGAKVATQIAWCYRSPTRASLSQ